MSRSRRVAVIHQPQIFPALHLVARIMQADWFVLLDTAQVNRKVGMAKYTISRSSGTAPRTLAVPLEGGSRVTCHDARIGKDDGWVKKHLANIRECYGRLMMQDDIMRMAKYLLEQSGERFSDVGFSHVDEVLSRFASWGCRVPDVKRASEFGWNESEQSHTTSERLAAMVKRLNCDVYYCGQEEDRPYLDTDVFTAAGIEVYSQRFTPPPIGDLSWIHWYANGMSTLRRALEDGMFADIPGVGTSLF